MEACNTWRSVQTMQKLPWGRAGPGRAAEIMAAGSKLGNDKGKRSIGAVQAGIDRKTGAMHDKAKVER